MRSLTPAQTLVVLTGLNLFNYLDRYVLSAVLPSVKEEFDMTDGQVGRVGTMFMIGYFLTSPLFGWLGDRASRKWLIAAGIFVWSLGTVFTGMAGTVAALLWFRVMVGVGEASYAAISPGWIADVYPKERRNNALTIFYVAIPVGAALGSIFGARIESMYDWRHAFILAGAPGLLLALVLLPFREPARGASDEPAGEGSAHRLPSVRDFLHLFTLRNYNLAVWGYTAYTFALGAFAIWGPMFLVRQHGMEKLAAGEFFGYVLFGAGLLGTMAGGFAATAWQRRNRAGYAWTLAGSMLAGAPLATAAFFVPDRTLAMGALAGAMFCCFLGTGPINTVILESVPQNLRSSAMAGSIFIIHLFGDLWSPEIVGRVSDATSLSQALLLLPGTLAVAGILWGLLGLLQRRTAAA